MFSQTVRSKDKSFSRKGLLHIKRFILKWKTSLIVVGTMVLLGVLALLFFPSLPPSEPADLNEDTVIISVAGEEKLPVPLSQPQTVTIEQKDGNKNVIVITEDGAYMDSSTCHNQICVHSGKVTRDNWDYRPDGAFIICLPNQVSVELVVKSVVE